MGIVTHRITDRNVMDLRDGTALVESALDGDWIMQVTPSGYLQPPSLLRVRRIAIAFITGLVLLWIRWVASNTSDIGTFFEIGNTTRFVELNATLALLAVGAWLSGAYILIFQQAHWFAEFPGWHFMNSLMMALYFTTVGLVSIFYLGMILITIMQWIAQLLSDDRK